MRRAAVVISSLLATLPGTAVEAQAPPASEIDAHVAAARTAAGQDYRATFVNLCLPSAPPAGRAGGGGAAPAPPPTPDRANWYAPPFKVFDNFYWLGTRQHSSWALQTSGGIVIIDTNFAWATEPEIIEGLTKLGLNPRDIKYVVISHAHGDHVGGAGFLQKRGARIVMSAADWDLMDATKASYLKPTRDVVATDGQKLTLGDTTVTLHVTPGHTLGHCGFYSARHDLLFSGDLWVRFMMRTQASPPWFSDDVKQVPASLAKARALGARWIVPGHYDFPNATRLRARFEQLCDDLSRKRPVV